MVLNTDYTMSSVLTLSVQYIGFVSFTILIWDHIDTLVDEVLRSNTLPWAWLKYNVGRVYMEKEERTWSVVLMCFLSDTEVFG